ncbi:MAG TPA: hypothetical protein VGN88_10520 [Phycisphaerae bacterium]|jgi:hypothetical protein
MMRMRWVLALMLVAMMAGAARAEDKPTVIVVVGAPGEPGFGAEFEKSADAWAEACKRATVNYIEIGREKASAKTDRQRFQEALQADAKNTQPLWIVLIGHGTSDGKEAKFNLRDLDFSDTELAAWLKPMARPIALIDCSSASASFLNKISAPGRVVITATRAASEVNYARFGIYMANAIANPAADLDKDGQTSLLEAFLAASRGVEDFYQSQGRLATEHALIDDNGDAQGTSGDWFEGTRATRSARGNAAPDGARAHQWFLIPSAEEKSLTSEMRSQRDSVELRIEALRQKKATMKEEDYYTQLDVMLLNLARLQLHPATKP